MLQEENTKILELTNVQFEYLKKMELFTLQFKKDEIVKTEWEKPFNDESDFDTFLKIKGNINNLIEYVEYLENDRNKSIDFKNNNRVIPLETIKERTDINQQEFEKFIFLKTIVVDKEDNKYIYRHDWELFLISQVRKLEKNLGT